MLVHLTVVISYRGPWLYLSFVLGVTNDGRTYKESYNECDDAICVLHWQCFWVVHMESKI